MTPQEVFSEATSVYDNYVGVLETGSVEALQDYARDLSERIIPRGVETHEVVGIVLLLRDVLARSLFEKYHQDFGLLNRVLDAYEPAANRIANTVAVSFVQERERIIRQQQDSLRELSTPVLQVRERLLILPIIGVLDDQRAHQLTEQLLGGIRRHRAKVVVIDITGVPDLDAEVANHLVQAVDASRLMGAGVIITGLSPEIAQTLVTIGVDLTKMNTVGDLQGGIEEAERQLGFKVSRTTGRRWLTRSRRRSRCGCRSSRQGSYLIASIHTALDDGQLVRFQHDLIERIGAQRARGVVIDVAALDVLDSFGSRTLRDIARMSRLRGAETVIVGIAPDAGHQHGAARAAPRPAHRARPRGGAGLPAVGDRHVDPAVTDALARLRLDYRSAFVGYLSHRGEPQLSSAYEIGRAAHQGRGGLLDLVQVHNAVTLDLLRAARAMRRAAGGRRGRSGLPGRGARPCGHGASRVPGTRQGPPQRPPMTTVGCAVSPPPRSVSR